MQNLIERLKERDPVILRQLIVKHQRLLYSIVLSCVNKDEADDIVQMTWERAIGKIHQLKEEDKFTPWLCRICRNILFEARRKNIIETEEFDDSLTNNWNEKLYEDYDGLVRLSIQMLPEAQRKVVQLRFFTNLSYSEIALVCNIHLDLVKSRLYEAKKSLKRHLSNLYAGLEVSPKKLHQIEEYIMNEFEKASLGATVFSCLSLDSQKQFVQCVKNNAEMNSELLKEIGKITEGSKFITEFHTKILLPDFINILNACDRYTEARLVKGLEESSPSDAELVKQNTFVFEDIVILSKTSRQRLYSRLDLDVIKRAMSIVNQKVKQILLADFPEEERTIWYRDMGALSTDLEEVREAQLQVVLTLREMDKKNEIEIVGMPEDVV